MRGFFQNMSIGLGAMLLALSGFAQVGGYDSKQPDVFEESSSHARNGWYLTPGVTHLLGIGRDHRAGLGELTIIQHNKAIGQTGAFLQFGRFHALNSRWINFVDYGLDVRWLRGAHEREVESRMNNVFPDWTLSSGTASFSDLWLGATVNASFARHINRSLFISHSLGVNANYAVLRDMNMDGLVYLMDNTIPPELSVQLHYKLGVGFNIGRGWYLMPTIETPILGILAWNDAIPSFEYLNAHYQPILIGVQIMKRDRRKPADCPTEGPSRRGQKSGLWGDKKMNRLYGN